jgi:hypothetical protein
MTPLAPQQQQFEFSYSQGNRPQGDVDGSLAASG